MKIAIITHRYPPDIGGLAESVSRISRLLSKFVEVHVIVAVNTKDYLTTEISDEVISKTLWLHRVKCNLDPNSPKRYAIGLEAFSWAIEKLDKAFNFDLLHAFYIIPSGFVSVLKAKKINKPVLVSVRGSDIYRDIYSLERFPTIKFTLDNADKISFISQHLFLQSKLIGKYRSKSVIIENSIAPQPQVLHHKSKEKKLKIGIIGEIRYSKGLGHLLIAFKDFIKNYPAELLILGNFQKDEKNAHMELIKKLDLQNNIKITGFLKKELMYDHLQQVDILVIPSLYEGGPNALLDGMSLGKPIIATDAGYAPNLVSNKEAIIIQPRSSKKLLGALIYLANKPKLREKLGNAARKKVKFFAEDKEVKQWLDVYRELRACR